MNSGPSGRSLALFFSRGVSLKMWQAAGNLEREVALYRLFAKQGWKITFVTYGHDDGRVAKEVEGIDVVWNRWRLPEKIYGWLLPLMAPQLRKAVIKSNQTDGADVALAVARRLRRPFVARCGYMLAFTAEQRHGVDSPEAARARRIEEEVFSGCQAGIVTTNEARSLLVTCYGISSDKLSVIPNYVDVDLFRPDPAAVRSPRRVVFVGRLHPEKGPLDLVRAAAGLDVELVLAGQGDQRAELEREAAKLGVAVEFRGAVPNTELPRLLNSAALYVAPSKYEGHPKALLEAMACGMAVIGNDVPGIRTVIRHGETGLLCPATVDGLRSAIMSALADDDLRARLGAAARAYVVDNFTLADMARRELQLLETLA